MVYLSAEDEECGTFNNRKISIYMRPDLIALEHKQLDTPLKIDNPTTKGFVNSGMKSKNSKTWDMEWHWLRDKEVIYQLRVYWYRGTNNDTDYFTKHHP